MFIQWEMDVNWVCMPVFIIGWRAWKPVISWLINQHGNLKNRYQSAALSAVQQMWRKVPKGRHTPYAMLLLWLLCKQLSNYHRFQSSFRLYVFHMDNFMSIVQEFEKIMAPEIKIFNVV